MPECSRTEAHTLAIRCSCSSCVQRNCALHKLFNIFHCFCSFQKLLPNTKNQQQYSLGLQLLFQCRYLYWTDYGQTPKIERALLDASNRTILATTGVVHPVGLVIDYNTHELYWADDKESTILKVVNIKELWAWFYCWGAPLEKYTNAHMTKTQKRRFSVETSCWIGFGSKLVILCLFETSSILLMYGRTAMATMLVFA